MADDSWNKAARNRIRKALAAAKVDEQGFKPEDGPALAGRVWSSVKGEFDSRSVTNADEAVEFIFAVLKLTPLWLRHAIAFLLVEEVAVALEVRQIARIPGLLRTGARLALDAEVATVAMGGKPAVLTDDQLEELKTAVKTAINAAGHLPPGVTNVIAGLTNSKHSEPAAPKGDDMSTTQDDAAGAPPSAAPPPTDPPRGDPPPENVYLMFLRRLRPLREDDVLNAPVFQREYWFGFDWTLGHRTDADAALRNEAESALRLLPAFTEENLRALDPAFQVLEAVREANIPPGNPWRVEATRRVMAALNLSRAWDAEIRRIARVPGRMGEWERLRFLILDTADDWFTDAQRERLRNLWNFGGAGGVRARLWQFALLAPVLLLLLGVGAIVLARELWNAEDPPPNTRPNMVQRLRAWLRRTWDWAGNNVRLVVGWPAIIAVLLIFGLPSVYYLYELLMHFRQIFVPSEGMNPALAPILGNSPFNQWAFDMNEWSVKAYVLRYFVMVAELLLIWMYGQPRIREFEPEAEQRRRDGIGEGGLPANTRNPPLNFAKEANPGHHPTQFEQVREAATLLRIWYRLRAIGYIRPYVIIIMIAMEGVMIACNLFVFSMLGMSRLWASSLGTFSWGILLLVDLSIFYGGWYNYEERKKFNQQIASWVLRGLAAPAVAMLVILLFTMSSRAIENIAQASGSSGGQVTTVTVPPKSEQDQCRKDAEALERKSPGICTRHPNVCACP